MVSTLFIDFICPEYISLDVKTQMYSVERCICTQETSREMIDSTVVLDLSNYIRFTPSWETVQPTAIASKCISIVRLKSKEFRVVTVDSMICLTLKKSRASEHVESI